MFSTTFHVISRKFWLLFGQRLSVCRCTLYSCRVCPALIFNTEWMWRCLRGFWHDFYFIVFVACECLVSWSHSRSESFWPNPDRNNFGRIRSQTGLSRIKWNLFSFQTELESVKFFWGDWKIFGKILTRIRTSWTIDFLEMRLIWLCAFVNISVCIGYSISVAKLSFFWSALAPAVKVRIFLFN